MKQVLFIFLSLPLLGISNSSLEQTQRVDSIKNLIKTAQNDSALIRLWESWSYIIYQSDPEQDFVLMKKIDSLSSINLKGNLNKTQRAFFTKTMAINFHNIGTYYSDRGNLNMSVKYYYKSLEFRERIGDQKSIASTLNSIGVIHSQQGHYLKAIECFTKSLKISEEIDYQLGIARCFNNLGIIYSDQYDENKAIEYYLKAFTLHQEMDNTSGIIYTLNNIGASYHRLGNFNKALEHYEKSFKIRQELGDKVDIANALMNIGSIHFDKGNLKSAIEKFEESLKLHEEIQDNMGISDNLSNIGKVLLEQRNNQKALEYGKRALRIAKTIGYQEALLESSKLLWTVYKKMGNHRNALAMHELHTQTKDSINSFNNQKALIHSEYKYKYEKEALADSIRYHEEQKRIQLDLDRQRAEASNTKLIGLICLTFTILAGLIVALIVNRKRVQQKNQSNIDQLKLEQRLLLTQMNPHFMFNALNSISAFISKNDTKEAKYFLAKFAKIMRQILEASRKQEITLEDEMAILENYVQLECLRSGMRFDYAFNVSPHLKESLKDFTIPPMLLQPFIENAIKHGLVNAKTRGSLQVSLERLDKDYIGIEIVDNGIGIKKSKELKEKLNLKHKSAAMDITDERLRGYNQSNHLPIEIKIEDLGSEGTSGTKVKVKLPIAA
ncbi:MAG: tetratricopeptide repeat protein [Flavobacteriales bacterium]|nr:tetratricopeptide repeat protein [Flavobacteriales bacterium]